MAGSLTISTLKDSSGVLATQNGMTGVAKAWVNYNGVAQTITNSFNVSSVTRNSTGNYNINFTTAMPNANYCLSGMASSFEPTDPSGRNLSIAATNPYGTPSNQTTSTVRVLFGYAGALFYDAGYISVVVHGN
jgi:hypothetical protein